MTFVRSAASPLGVETVFTTANTLGPLRLSDEISITELFTSLIEYFPAGMAAQAAAEPIYETMDGWPESTRGARSWMDLPATAIKYIRRIEELIEAPVAMLSTSPERDDTILVRDPFTD